jgi:hypothetical protein
MMGWTGIGGILRGSRLLASPVLNRPAAGLPAFEEISASASGIHWTHVSGRSPMAHLPETVGAGCAFFD